MVLNDGGRCLSAGMAPPPGSRFLGPSGSLTCVGGTDQEFGRVPVSVRGPLTSVCQNDDPGTVRSMRVSSAS